MDSLLERMPLLVLELICEYLNYDGWGRRSLFAFSSVSRRCCAVATRERFKHMQLIFQDEEDVARALDRCKEILGVERMRYVRHITVKQRGSQPGEDDDIGIAKEEETYSKPLVSLGILSALMEYSPPTSEAKRRQHEIFTPLSHFIRQLPGLRDLIWAAPNQIPSTILTAVEHQHIRLHDCAFCLRSLIQPGETSQGIDVDELALATTPSLYSITASHESFNTRGHINHNPDAIMQMAAGLAPNLKSVTLFGQSPGNPFPLMRSVRLPISLRQGVNKDLDIEEIQTTAIGQLTRLSFEGSLIATSETLKKWSNFTDFSLLQMLELSTNINGLRTIHEMAHDKPFANLRGLSLDVIIWTHWEEREIDRAAAEFLSALHPLESLRLRGFAATTSFYTLLEIHGPALRKLQFMPNRFRNSQRRLHWFSSDVLHELPTHCPNLEEVELLIDRTKGDTKEVQLYRTLSTIRKIKCISLGLDSSLRPAHTSDGESAEQQNECYMRDRLINSAIDSTLAISIFEILSSGNSTLQVFKLFIADFVGYGPQMDTAEFLDILRWIGRSWACWRDPSNMKNINVRELKKNTRIDCGTHIPERLEDFHPGEPIARVWRELWPEVEVNWKDDWRSFPLASL